MAVLIAQPSMQTTRTAQLHKYERRIVQPTAISTSINPPTGGGSTLPPTTGWIFPRGKK